MLTQEQIAEFTELSKPLVKWINDNGDPHTEVLIDSSSARIVSGVCGVPIDEYIKS